MHVGAWRPFTSDLVLGIGEVHIWRIQETAAECDAQYFETLLSWDERSAQQMLLRERDRLIFALNRGLLRCLLGRYLRLDPSLLSFGKGLYGKPELVRCESYLPLHFNLSHTSGLTLFACTRSGEIGIDVELIDAEVDAVRMARWVVSNESFSRLSAHSDRERMEIFYDAWTALEARAKAFGTSSALSIDGIQKEMIEPKKPSQGEVCEPTIVKLDAGAGYSAALASFAGDLTCYCWDWPRGGLNCLPP